MSSTLRLVLVALSILLAAACASTADGDDSSPTIAGAWTVTAIGGAPIIEGSTVSLWFDADGSFGGNTGVNAMSGTWITDGTPLPFSEIAMTRRAGRPELMDQETRILAAIGRTQSFATIEDAMLVLSAKDGTVLLRAVRTGS